MSPTAALRLLGVNVKAGAVPEETLTTWTFTSVVWAVARVAMMARRVDWVKCIFVV